jgi:hypothetical protein
MRPNSCGPLTTIGEVVRELARVYRAAKRGDMDSSLAARLANILKSDARRHGGGKSREAN